MKPIDFRNESFSALHARLESKREAVWLDWMAYEVRHGKDGATTRQVCEWNGRDILQFRPRCTELYQIGVLQLGTGNAERGAREGFYKLRSLAEWEQWHREQAQAAFSGQQQLL